MPSKTFKLLIASSAILALGLCAIALLLVGSPGAPPLPHPNGYDDYTRAGNLIAGDVGNYQSMDFRTLTNLISSNEEALNVIRLGLSHTCCVPTELAISNFRTTIGPLSNTKRIAQLLRAQGRLLELQNHPGAAAKNYIEGLRFGNEVSRGGFVIHRLVGIACEAIAGIPLARLIDDLDSEEMRKLLPEMERLDRERVSFEETRHCEKLFARHELMRTANPVQLVVGWRQSRDILKQTQIRHNTTVAHERLIMIEMALRCYQSDHHNMPANLDQLVPQYLSRVPPDPFNEQPFRYKTTAGQWLVYSVGPDGADDGGKPITKNSGTNGDITYSSSW
ncbi:MAG TPA: hypothetical protein VKY92_21835 [Verrucomicrobiae bacterium]|nr:hypothetical protein [Verrucomicrobiae bacterium]